MCKNNIYLIYRIIIMETIQTELEKETNTEYYEKLDKYFKLKQKYEKKIKTTNLSIINNTDLSKKEKIKKIRSIQYPCINCKRKVGSNFILDNRTYKAYCGSTDTPCSLNIELKRPTITNIYNAKSSAFEDMKDTQNDMIIAKLQLLFGFMNEDEMVEIYTSIKDVYKTNLDYYDLLDEFVKNIENKQEKKTIVSQAQTKYYDSIKDLKQLVREYLTTNNSSLLTDAIETYIQDIKPNQLLIRQNKYDDYFIDEDNENHIIQLRKIKKNIENTEYNIDEPEIIQFTTKTK